MKGNKEGIKNQNNLIAKILGLAIFVATLANLLALFYFRVDDFLNRYQRTLDIRSEPQKYYFEGASGPELFFDVLFDGWLFAVPYFIVMLILSWIFVKKARVHGRIKKGFLIGSLVAGTGVLLLISFSVLTRFSSILHDGTTEWALVHIPATLFGIPCIIIGALLGGLVGLVVSRIKARKFQP